MRLTIHLIAGLLIVGGAGILMGAAFLATNAQDPPGFRAYSVKWVKFEDTEGGMHFYWLDGKDPFEIALPDYWFEEFLKKPFPSAEESEMGTK